MNPVIQLIWTHGLVCTGVLLLFYLLVSSRRLWYLVAGLYWVSMALLVTYAAVHAMTGQGFNEAALYYTINASWKDVALLGAYESLRWMALLALMLTVVFVWVVRKVRLARLLSVSMPSQALLAVVGAGFGLFMTPLAADVSQAMQVSGMNKKDSIGLAKTLQGTDVPQVLSGAKKNLIMVYAESMEAAFYDEQLFPGLLPRLNRLAEQGVRFDRIEQSPMSNWTIAGMIASQCGVPLSSHRLRNEINDFGKFSSGYKCLADHLQAQGYWRVYMGGASGAFAGKGDYYRNMEFQEVLGLDELARPDSRRSTWGLYDEDLLPLVINKITSLRTASRAPFALVALTLDSHPPAGFASPVCERQAIRYGDGANLHLNAIRCTDELLGDFMEKVVRENLHDSTIVLLSDHVMMNSQASLALEARGAMRLNHMVIWDKDFVPQTVHRVASQFDVTPTVLQALLGRSYQVGFGTSMLDVGRANLMERYGSDAFDESVYAWRTESWRKW